MLWPTPYEKLTLQLNGLINSAGLLASRANKGNMGGLFVGMIIGIVWAPCAGPILASILTLIARQEDLLAASILLVAYSLGAGIPMLVIAYGGQYITTKVRVVAIYGVWLQKFFGIIIIMLAVAIFFQYDTLIQAKLLELIPLLNPKY
jgi:cytochrome c biogenesis protein CcdA